MKLKHNERCLFCNRVMHCGDVAYYVFHFCANQPAWIHDESEV